MKKLTFLAPSYVELKEVFFRVKGSNIIKHHQYPPKLRHLVRSHQQTLVSFPHRKEFELQGEQLYYHTFKHEKYQKK